MKALIETRRGSAGNVIAAIASAFYPGIGQLAQGRLIAAALFALFATITWVVLMGWVFHIWAAYDAAVYEG